MTARHEHEHEDPSVHSFILAGRDTVFGYHLAMFGMAEHRYQVVLEYRLPTDIVDIYLKDRADHPESWHAVRNTEDMVLPPIGDGTVSEYPARLDRVTQTGNGEDRVWEPISGGFTARIERVLTFRRFSEEDFPAHLTYLIYGRGDEAHIAHRLVKRPHYEQIVTLQRVPEGVTQDDLARAVELSVPGVPDGGHGGLPWTTRPLPDRTYPALLHRDPARPTPITLTLGDERWWNITTLNA
ncbi:hypothetical protein [Kitasatospora sp. DSM 101779]|uniref:hypothetical protein n=1 Tax=Kitasatospora sp. DSM 101779 TaxID=2853165 RepID=UPI0021DA750D|nr:hypothetical protein [Kitasatospora sp. DSM 101779]MCU7820783.1 hypothetical protein [Kitasatospora sp. DSM 101779]